MLRIFISAFPSAPKNNPDTPGTLLIDSPIAARIEQFLIILKLLTIS